MLWIQREEELEFVVREAMEGLTKEKSRVHIYTALGRRGSFDKGGSTGVKPADSHSERGEGRLGRI